MKTKNIIAKQENKNIVIATTTKHSYNDFLKAIGKEETKINTKENDLIILKQLYAGNHLNNLEIERAKKLLYLLNVDLNSRIKN